MDPTKSKLLMTVLRAMIAISKRPVNWKKATEFPVATCKKSIKRLLESKIEMTSAFFTIFNYLYDVDDFKCGALLECQIDYL